MWDRMTNRAVYFAACVSFNERFTQDELLLRYESSGVSNEVARGKDR